MSCNNKAKGIICGNVAKSLIAIQDEVRLWMTNPSSKIHGTTALVIGSEDTVRKQLCTVQFTSSFSNEEIEDPTVFTPRILIGTSGCIGAGIDCDDISLVARLGMPTSLMHLIQEMGRCGRNASGEYENTLNCYHVIFTLKDFFYLNERLFYEEKCDDETEETSDGVIQTDDNEDTISIEKHREMMQKSLHRCAQLMTLNIGCWHEHLENECGCPQDIVRNELNDEVVIGCDGKCPRCDGSMQMMMQPVLRNGFTMFLIDAFGDNYNGKVTPIMLSRQLFEFEMLGK